MDSADALRLVVFEYLLPGIRAHKLHDIIIEFYDVHELSHCTPCEQLTVLADRLLASFGYPSSFLPPRRRRHRYPQTVDALLLFDTKPRHPGNYLQDIYVFCS